MADLAFQLGQYCSAMDELHIGYCSDVRKGNLPNSLIGNQAYSVALQNPIKALAILASRIKPYEAWARKSLQEKLNKTDNNAIKSGVYAYLWLSKQSMAIGEKLQDQHRSLNDYYKAELMLGYFSGRPFKNKPGESNLQHLQGDKE